MWVALYVLAAGAPHDTINPSAFPRPCSGTEGQCTCYVAGKTTFIKHLLGREYPGIHIGPEPTTDRFVVVMGGMEERRTPGNTLIVQPDKPYQVPLLTLT